jgi:protein SCO1/2
MKTKIAFTTLFVAAALVYAAESVRSTAPDVCSACCAEEKPAAPLSARSLYQLDAKWTNDAGIAIQLAGFRGQPVIVAMFFAQCEYACPMLVSDILRVQAGLPAEMRNKAKVVLVTFDSTRDTVEALSAYRRRLQLDETWTLLRGETSAVQDLAMLLGVKFKQDARGQFAHSNLLTLLNAEGEIVGQRAGLQGDVSDLTQAVKRAIK